MLAKFTLPVAAILVAVSQFSHTVLAADAPPAASNVQKIFDAGWKASAENYAAAQAQYEQAKKNAPADVRVPYAMSLVAVQNNNLPDAAMYLDEALKNGKSLLPIRRVKIWLDLLRKDKEAAKADVRELARQLTLDPAAASRPEFQETAKWLGAVLGFYANPGKDQLSAADVEALSEEIDRRMSGAFSNQLAAGKLQVDRQFAELQSQLESARATAKQSNEVKQEDSRKRTEELKSQTAARKAQAEREYAALQEKIQQEVPSKQRDLASTERSIADLTRLKTDLKNSLDAEKKKDQQNNVLISQLQSQARVVDDNLNRAKNAAKDLRSDLNSLANQNSALAREIKKQENAESVLTRKANDLEKPASSNDATTNAQQTLLKSFKSYAGINLDQEKKRILDSFQPPVK